MLETKYRDIADGNVFNTIIGIFDVDVGNQVPRYSGWKHVNINDNSVVVAVGNQVPLYSGWKYTVESHLLFMNTICEPTGFLTRIINSSHNTAILIPLHSRQSS